MDELVDKLAQIPQVGKAYALWYELREEVLRTHRDNLPERLPLSRQKEFKQIKNMVIQEAVRLGELSAVFRSEKISDEPEDDPVPKGEQHLWRQAARYREAKKILYDEESPPEEKRAALAKLEQLYDESFSVAAHLLGKVYRDGVSVEADEKAAEWWFCKPAAAGNDYSEYALGKLLEQQERFTEAAGWHQKAAEQNNQYAQYRLAKLLLDGEEVPKDAEKAVRLLTAAAGQDNQYAQYTLERYQKTVRQRYTGSPGRRNRTTSTPNIFWSIWMTGARQPFPKGWGGWCVIWGTCFGRRQPPALPISHRLLTASCCESSKQRNRRWG